MQNLLQSLIIQLWNTNKIACYLHFPGTILDNLGRGSSCSNPWKNVSPANQHPFRNNELQEETRRCRRGGPYLELIFSDCLSSSRSVLKSIWPMPSIFSNFEIHLEDCGVVSDWVMRRGKVKLNFRVSVWPLIAVYQQHDQHAPKPVSASWCSESNVWGITGKPVATASVTLHGCKQSKPLMTHSACAYLMHYKGQRRTNASFCSMQSWVSRVRTTFREGRFHSFEQGILSATIHLIQLCGKKVCSSG